MRERVRNDVRVDMPPLPLLVLDGLADDFESVRACVTTAKSLHTGSHWSMNATSWPQVRSLLADGLIEPWAPSGAPVELVPQPTPATDDESLRTYWFRWTRRGEAVWREGGEILDSYRADGRGSA